MDKNGHIIIHILYLLLLLDVAYLEAKVGVCSYRSKSDPLEDAPQDIIRRNLNDYLKTISKAQSENVKLIVFPEGGLTTLAPFRERHDVLLKYSLDLYDWNGSCPCTKEANDSAIVKLSCAAKSNRVYVVVNILEKESQKVDSLAYNIYNTNLVFNDTGHIIVRYRKIVPGITNATFNGGDNKNNFKVCDKEYITIIGNDIYKEDFNKLNSNNVSVLWSTASKSNCSELPALTLAQIFQSDGNIKILIADYGDDEWSSSCIYYNRTLYYEDQSDGLILVPSDKQVHTSTREFKSSCVDLMIDDLIKKAVERKKEANNNGECTINDSESNNSLYRNFFSGNFSKTENDKFEVSFCGIVAIGKSGNNVSATNAYVKTMIGHDREIQNLSITWKKNCTDDVYLPITADMRYWPLNTYDYSDHGDGSHVRINLTEKTEFLIFALMRIRNKAMNCINIKNKSGQVRNSNNNQIDHIDYSNYSVLIIVIAINLLNMYI